MAAPLMLSFPLAGQQTVTGKVTDLSTGSALPSATVQLAGTYYFTSTDQDGNFRFPDVKGGNVCVIVRYPTYQADTVCFSLPQEKPAGIALLQTAATRDEVIILATRADENSGVAYSTVTKEEIEQQNYGQDVPYILNNEPSVVTTSDAGAGVGYTGIRIRGSDATRVNVTINGIPVNDAESQGTYWVDIPDLASSTEDIQVQRGVGTSANGAGAFGGSINLRTDALATNPYSTVMLSGGSYNTFRSTAKFGTGLLNQKWAFDGRLSYIRSDGYIDRASSDLRSWYFSGGYYGDNLTIKAITFSGREKTYQSWYGVVQDSLATNRTYNMAGEYYDMNGNIHYYNNETDNYGQDYYQLHFSARGNANWNFNLSFHATKGNGYYEQYKQGQFLADYGIYDTTGMPVDLVRRLWLDNWFYGITYAIHYDDKKKLNMTIGGAFNNYEGAHYDEIIWATNLPQGIPPVYRYNNNFAVKSDGNIFARLNYSVTSAFNIHADLQYRMTGYHFTGFDTNFVKVPQEIALNFVNPKLGLTWRASEKHTFYGFFGIGNKEPNRDDFVNTTSNSRPKHETLFDTEAGWKFGSEKFALNANLYYMRYKNQLVLTGKINDVGAYTRENVAESYRRGIELSGGWNITKQLSFQANITLSQNRITGFTEYIDDY
ncbi:MAG TPA: TonB-dependent receptor, partial [Bacteroidia bacterium]|nr:TonB-dependent receptor [Bacteroidia bacterium]